MKVKTLLTFTAIVSSILGAIVVYLVLSVPNDLQADGLLKDARKDITDGKHDDARTKLTKIVQTYPRTDGAAAATVALVSLADKDVKDLQRAVTVLRKQNDTQTKKIATLEKSLTDLKNAPPKVVEAPKPAPAKKPTVTKKKPTTKKKTTPKRRRR